MRAATTIIGGLLLAGLGIAGCSANGGEKPGATAGKPPVAVEVTAVEPGDVTEGVEVVGTLAPKFEAQVKSEVPGRVTDVYVTQWVRVSKGQPLARVDTTELEVGLERARAAVEAARSGEEAARAGLLEAKVGADRAEREYQRLLKLREAGLATQQSLDDGLTAKEAAQARIRAAQAQIEAARAQVGAAREDVRQLETRLAKAVIRSPLNGVVSERIVNVGDLPGDAVAFRVVDNSLLDLTVTVPSRDLASVRVGHPLAFSTDALPGETFTGKVMFINPSADPADRSVRVTAEVRNAPERLRGGLFVKGRIVTGKRSGVLQVPRSALLTWDVAAKKGDVFVVTEDTARRRSVQTASVLGDRVEIASGLKTGEAVVTRGGFNLKDGDKVSAAPAKGGG
jgi:RND family efflux transporter MFP subunit